MADAENGRCPIKDCPLGTNVRRFGRPACSNSYGFECLDQLAALGSTEVGAQFVPPRSRVSRPTAMTGRIANVGRRSRN